MNLVWQIWISSANFMIHATTYSNNDGNNVRSYIYVFHADLFCQRPTFITLKLIMWYKQR